ncbi:MAG: sigma 54-interacting transcriptional regulator [bacterium]
MPQLHLIIEGQVVERFILSQKEVFLGRSPESDIKMFDQSISRKHVSFTRTSSGHYIIKDISNRNKIMVNGKMITQYTLQPNDRILLGKTELIYFEDSKEETDTIPLKKRHEGNEFDFNEGMLIKRQTWKDPLDQIDGEDLETGYQRLKLLYRMMKSISGTLNYNEFLKTTIDILFKTINIDRGCICLLGEGSDEYEVVISRGNGIVDSSGYLRASHYMINKVIKESISVLTVDAGEDARYKNRKSIRNFHIKSVMCVPLLTKSKMLGFIYLDNSLQAQFTEKDLEFLMSLAQQIAISIENINLHKKLKEENVNLLKMLSHTEKIIGESAKMKSLFSLIDRVAKHDTTVLITGETGTGKELVARALHNQSSRSSRPFICVTCALFSQSLIESELFGFEKGAFTGADKGRTGKLELADKGTIFLDEIGEIGLEAQVKLLRFLERREVERIGSNKTMQLDVRVVAATNKDLAAAVKDGAFREDLYYRLNAITIDSPPLRERKEDIPLITRFYLEELAKQIGRKPKKISKKALDLLISYHWPGNVRELKNIIERAVVLGAGDVLYIQDFPEDIRKSSSAGISSFKTLGDIEKQHIVSALIETGGNKSKAASLLDIGRATLYEKLKSYGIQPSEYTK